ncbi:apolipoprotein N-acyltransferase [Winogradskyella aurantiaca]|uniref:apolipoprotein N-acyltransferase n=1 Tax=Winogradskyella aurantiaca TaxID=2219558 RepID=UPI000E1CE5C8|nr:apolipoprotein N-acyltransferase [Winogradskyella aurantiaca]
MKKLLAVISSGLLLALSWPTYGFPLPLFFAFVPLLAYEQRIRTSDIRRKRTQLFFGSYLTFIIWNTFTTSWLWFADPFGCLFAIGVNSALMAVLILFYHSVAKRTNAFRSLVFLILLWLCFEKLHLSWEFSWPWLNLGNAFSEQITWIQWYEYTGTFGGTLWVWIGNVLAFRIYNKYNSGDRVKGLKKPGLILVSWIVMPIAISMVMFYNYKPSHDTVAITVLQPNIDPYEEKYQLSNLEIAKTLVELADTKNTDATPDFILAPETVFADNARLGKFADSDFINELKKSLYTQPKTSWLTGIAFIEFINDPTKVTEQSNFYRKGIWYNDYNSAILIQDNAEIPMYHKSKLVVGVENFPYQSVLKPIIGDAMIDLGGTVAMKTTQDTRAVFTGTNEAHKIAPIICYESVYGEFVTEYVRNGANVLGIITNDAWWGNTQGHQQHLSYARLRAIETRRSIARSANTGISAFINPKGELLSSLPYDTQGALSSQLPLETKETFYVVAGDYLARIAIFITPLMFLIIRFRKPRI